MKVIFLDFDGVLNNKHYRETVIDYYNNPISDYNMCFLEYVIKETKAKIVLSTTWRHYWNEGKYQIDKTGDLINNIFDKFGLKIYSKTPTINEDRDAEISEWLNSHQVESFVILDDINFGWLHCNSAYFVLINDFTGLDEDTAKLCIDILNNKNTF